MTCDAPGLIRLHRAVTVEETIARCTRPDGHDGLHTDGEHEWGAGAVVDAQAKI